MLDLSHISTSSNLSKDVTHSDAKKEPLHNWFPYLEGFSEMFIENIMNTLDYSPTLIYEPFSGSGTVPVYCKRNNINCFYSEVNPFLIELTDLKLSVFEMSIDYKELIKEELLTISKSLKTQINSYKKDLELLKNYNAVFGNSIYFEPKNFDHVLRLKTYINVIENNDVRNFVKVASCQCLLHGSLLKRAGDIRYKRGKEKENIPNIIDLIIDKIETIAYDLELVKQSQSKPSLEYNLNAKHFNSKYEGKVNTIITSPPYLNGTNYIKNTKLELWFLGYLKQKSGLSNFRKEVVTSGINDVSSKIKNIQLPFIQKILEDKSLWYDKRIPKMITDYFFDMNIVIENFYNYLQNGGIVFLDIGDSVYADQHIPTDLILIELFKNNGFKLIENLKLRDRRSKSGRIVKQCLLILQK
jgi:DNA modification methylase